MSKVITLTNSKMDCKSQICLHLQFQQVVYFFCSLISVRLCDCFTNCEINQRIIGYIAYGQWIIYHTLVASKVYNAFTFISVTLYIPPSYHSQNCFCFFFFSLWSLAFCWRYNFQFVTPIWFLLPRSIYCSPLQSHSQKDVKRYFLQKI